MSDIDLIPHAYRTRRWQTRWLKSTAWLVAGLTGALMLTWAALGLATDNARANVAALQNKL